MVELLMEHYGVTESQAIKLLKMPILEAMDILHARQRGEITVLGEKQ